VVLKDTRQACLLMAHTFLAHRSECHYSEESDRWEWRSHPSPVWPYFGDCSATVTALCFYSHGNDPSGQNFAPGNTKSILAHAFNDKLIVTKARLLTCDFILFGMEPDGVTPRHVVMALAPGTEPDPLVFSMGQPGDPQIVPYSACLGIGPPIFVHNHTDVA